MLPPTEAISVAINTATTTVAITIVASTIKAMHPHHKEMEVRMNIFSKIKEQLTLQSPEHCSCTLLEQAKGFGGVQLP